MVSWVVAAAAAAGFLSKYWENVVKERDVLSESFGGDLIESGDLATEDKQFDNTLECGRLKDRDRMSLWIRRHRRQCSEEVSGNFDRSLPILSDLDVHPHADIEKLGMGYEHGDFLSDPSKEMASMSSVNETLTNSRKDEKKERFCLVSLFYSRFGRKTNDQEHGDMFEGNVEFGDDLSPGLNPKLSPRNFDPYYGFRRSRNTINMKKSWGFPVKPVTSIESCLIAHLYREYAEMDDYVFSSLPSPSKPGVRPSIITDGKRIISTANNNPIVVQFENQEHKLNEDKVVVQWREEETLIGIPPLPEIDRIEPKRNLKQRRGKLHQGKLSSPNMQTSGLHLSSEGLFQMLLFCFGISFGMMSTIILNKREVDRLNELVKQTENLVQDLQEQLEMKDTLTVRELAYDASQLQENNDHSVGINELDKSYQYDEENPRILKVEENSESMSKIEAELEAELQRLELSMKTSNLEGGYPDLDEIDPELIADVVHGELRVSGGAEGAAASDPDASSTTSTAQPHTSNYAVSPRDLSLRLHQVIQSRLEEQIEELETALHKSQVQLRSLESLKPRKRFLNSNKESVSMRDSPTRLGLQALERHLSDEEEDAMVHPLYPNLSEDALNAYDEAYGEFIRMTKTGEHNSTSTIDCSSQGLYQEHPSCGENGPLERNSSRGSDEISESDSDEEGKLLIKHIVEKTRQGSPVVQNARRLLLLSMDE